MADKEELCDTTVRSVVDTILKIPDVTCEECMMVVEAITGSVLEACQPIDFNAVVDVLARNLKLRYVEIQAGKGTLQ